MGSTDDPEVVARTITFDFGGRTIRASEGETVAAALLGSGVKTTGTRAVSGRARGPFCLIGVCFECLVEIDGISDQRACLTTVQQGMKVRQQPARRLLMTGNVTHDP